MVYLFFVNSDSNLSYRTILGGIYQFLNNHIFHVSLMKVRSLFWKKILIYMNIIMIWFLKVILAFNNSDVPDSECDNEQKQPSTGILIKRCSDNMQLIYRRPPMPKCDFSKVTFQIYWNHTSAWVFSRKFLAYFQNTFSLPLGAASEWI